MVEGVPHGVVGRPRQVQVSIEAVVIPPAGVGLGGARVGRLGVVVAVFGGERHPV